MSLSAVAEAVGKSRAAAYRWRNGGGIHPDTLNKIADLLDVTPEWLETGQNPVRLQVHPITVWDEIEDLPAEDYVFIPRMDIHASCGNGSCVLEESVLDKPQSFRHEWIVQEKGINPKEAICIYAKGDSMEPRIFEGDTLLIDRSEKARHNIQDGRIYLIRYGDEIRVKQLFKNYDGGIKIHSFNPNYPDEVVPREALENSSVDIIGRVIWVGGEV